MTFEMVASRGGEFFFFKKSFIYYLVKRVLIKISVYGLLTP